MAAGCYVGRKLSELLEEQQEPFLLHHATTEAAPPCCSRNGDATGRRPTLGRAVRRAVRLTGCFSCAARESFRRLPLAGDTGGSHCDDGDDHGGRRLSPVSVFDVLQYSDEESHSSPTLSNWEEEDELSWTSGSSPASSLLTGGATSPPTTLFIADGKTRARAAKEATTRRSEEEQGVISSWERISGDIARVPTLARLDISSSGSTPEWMPRRRRLGLVEASRLVGANIEAMIFEEVRAEAVRDMLSLHS